ncbi:MAG: alkyl hydroperoxide reductase/Thiol specific antioxidant/Mal allergen, partial [Thermomicrobiales bacterium]|nr:alkyl hydroperoxide reductase/Thiol specific antioxidant/Mal allergen [Thermomicrobiales bacterium]
MTLDPEPRVPHEAPALADDPEDDKTVHGRVGYGRIGRYSPLVLGLLLVLVITGIWWTQRDASPGAASLGQMAGKPVPDVTLMLLDGSPLRLSDLRGDVVVVNFWASWCEPCRTEMPELQAFWDAAQTAGERTTIVGVGIRTDVDKHARDVVAAGGFTYPIGRDTNTDQPGIGPIEAAFGIPSAYPSTVV